MTGAALRAALLAWMRHPREMALANFAAFSAIFLPVMGLPLLPPALRAPGFLGLALWVWMVCAVLCAVCARLDLGLPGPGRAAWAWLKAAAGERAAAFAFVALAALWLALTWNFYHVQVALPPALVRAMLGFLGAVGLWLALALLLSFGVAAEGGRTWFGLWKASALLPLAYFPAACAAGLIFFLALVFPALAVNLKLWSARLWMAPLLMCPFFTLSFLAAYLTALVRAMLDKVRGLAPETPPSWRELWALWK